MGHSIGYVPTMGALHPGHVSLVSQSVKDNDSTCVSIFVNPLQFNSQQDFDNYPDTLPMDLELLLNAECNMAYSGTLKDFFPEHDGEFDPTLSSSGSSPIGGLEADFRPGHLQGVAAIVERLFRTVGSCRTYFGEKDFQQTLLVRQIAEKQGNVEVIVCPTIREKSGLAMSSRNQRLSASALDRACQLYAALEAADRAWKIGERSASVLEKIIQNAIHGPEIKLEYAAVRDPCNWTATTPEGLLESGQALIAAELEGIRLIDNIRLGS